MKDGIHPQYREVIFYDHAADFKFLTRSTVKADQTIEFNGKTYPMVTVPISSASHPFFTARVSLSIAPAGGKVPEAIQELEGCQDELTSHRLIRFTRGTLTANVGVPFALVLIFVYRWRA